MTGEAPRRAMVLAAGRGIRLRPITEKTPKALVQVGGRALIDYSLDRLAAAGVERAVVNIHHLAEQLESHLKHRAAPEIVLSPEAELLDTGGGVVAALDQLGEQPFYVANSDSLWLDGPTPALRRLARAFDPERMDMIMLMHSTVEAYGYRGKGDFHVAPDGALHRRAEVETVPYVYTGVKIVHPRVFAGAPAGAFSFNQLYDAAAEAGRLYGIVHDGEWFHVGTPDGLAEAERYMHERFPGIRHR